jgi:hypothetical protein
MALRPQNRAAPKRPKAGCARIGVAEAVDQTFLKALKKRGQRAAFGHMVTTMSIPVKTPIA